MPASSLVCTEEQLVSLELVHEAMATAICFHAHVAAVSSTQGASCELWCDRPCSELTGDVHVECGGCVEPMQCRPGAETRHIAVSESGGSEALEFRGELSWSACRDLLRLNPRSCDEPNFKHVSSCAEHCEPTHDAFNDFGMHALPSDDAAWTDAGYLASLAAHSSGRLISSQGDVPVVSGGGPVHPLLFDPYLENILGRGYALRAVVGSGSDAVRELWTVAAASNPVARLLWLRGGYLSGYSLLQNSNAVDDIREYAYARTGWLDAYSVDGPYVRCVECPCPSCDAEEADALQRLQERMTLVEARGEVAVGVLFEGVRAKDGFSLRPGFVSALRAWLDARAMLLLEDAVLAGLRTGYPFLTGHYYEAEADFVAVGKAYGFSGVIENLRRRDSTAMASLRERQAVPTRYLNGYRTMAISALDVLRARAVLRAVVERDLLANARRSGGQLQEHLRAAGMRVWGLGLLLWFNRTTGCPANMLTAFDRLVPPLTFGVQPAEIASVRVATHASRHVLVQLSRIIAIADVATTMSKDDGVFLGDDAPRVREEMAASFAASTQRTHETGDVSWNCDNVTCSCYEYRDPL